MSSPALYDGANVEFLRDYPRPEPLEPSILENPLAACNADNPAIHLKRRSNPEHR